MKEKLSQPPPHHKTTYIVALKACFRLSVRNVESHHRALRPVHKQLKIQAVSHCRNEPDDPKDLRASLLCLSVSHSWARWGSRSCASCWATGMERASCARARWDWWQCCMCHYCAVIVTMNVGVFFYEIERFIRMGIPSSLRGRVWKCLLAIDSLRDNSDFNYQVRWDALGRASLAVFCASTCLHFS